MSSNRGSRRTKAYQWLTGHARTIINSNGPTQLAIAMAFAVTIVMEHRDVSNKLNIGRFNNRCMACISDNTDHFVGELNQQNV
jgi:hypothetical protein